ncbi:MAG: DUF5688 family protein [Anaerovoracaceae bacterium]
MMNYENFKQAVENDFMKFMPEKYAGMKMEVKPAKKINRNLDGVGFTAEDSDSNVTPVIYIQDLYEQYRKTGSMENVLKTAAETFEAAMDRLPAGRFEIKWQETKENIVFQIINYEKNTEFLEDVPHRRFCDMAVIYRIILGNSRQGISSLVINSQVAKQLALDETELFELAKENSSRLFPPVVEKLKTIVSKHFERMGIKADICENASDRLYPELIMYVITNRQNINGASVILYDGILERLAEKIGDNLYILPSSIHEVIVMPALHNDSAELEKMVTEINAEQVSPGERLSDHVYFYDKTAKTFSMASER